MKRCMLIICLCVAVIFISCNGTPPPSSVTDDNINVEYSIYWDSSAFVSAEHLLNENINLKNARDKTFSFARKIDVENMIPDEEKRSLKICGKNYEVTYQRSYLTELHNSNEFVAFSEFVSYEKDNVRVDFRNNTETIIFFSNFNTEVLTMPGDMTEESAKHLATDTLVSLYGQQTIDGYVFDEVVYTDTSLKKGYTVVFRKFVYAIPTNDTIQISFNMVGELLSINASLIGIYDGLENSITQDQIINAKEKLYSSISDEWTVSEPILIIDSLGEYYLKANAVKRDDTEVLAVELYINVE